MKGAIFMPKIIEKTSKNGVITAFSDGLRGVREGGAHAVEVLSPSQREVEMEKE
jgi:hypothetical protein